ncbi:hypothetical protein L1049_002925 [Liquidambar formosana]|uniref:Uncharacterized protein n=1 Tax=Liquidambar formosana TaxID=63359 RepID=A0AAP0R9F3_LIQFO
MQTSKLPQHMAGENPTSSGRSSGALSPRLQQKKLGLEKQSRPSTPSDSSRTRRQSSRQPTESSSPQRKLRPRSPKLQQSEQSSEISTDTRCLSQQCDAISLQSESNISLVSQSDTEVTSRDRSDEINGTFFQQGGQKHKVRDLSLSRSYSILINWLKGFIPFFSP